jgi:hypothetical protein
LEEEKHCREAEIFAYLGCAVADEACDSKVIVRQSEIFARSGAVGTRDSDSHRIAEASHIRIDALSMPIPLKKRPVRKTNASESM